MGSDPQELPASQQIDAIIRNTQGWRGEMLARLRAAVLSADPELVEQVKWKKPSRPEGVPVWARDGNVCIADILKNAVRLTFPKGAQMQDPEQIFNTRLDSKSVRAIDFGEGDDVDEAALQEMVRQAVSLNQKK